MIPSQSMFHTKLSTLKNTTRGLYLHSYILLTTARGKKKIHGRKRKKESTLSLDH